MSALYWNPTYYGIDDVTVGPGAFTSSGSTEPFAARVYFPTDYSTLPISIRPGTYRLIVFTHGDRSAPRPDPLCPPDIALDYQRWEAALNMLARCGFVVVSPDVSDVSYSAEQMADRIEATVAWMRRGWRHASSLQLSPVFEASAWMAGPPPPTPPDPLADDPRVAPERTPEPNDWRGRFRADVALIGVPTATALVGHSYGAKAGCIVIGRGNVQIRAFASIAGTFDDNNVSFLVASGIPTLLMAGNEDHETLSYLNGLWASLSAPKHQAVLQGIGHWDWFGPGEGIQPCSPDAERPKCPIAWQTASELLLGFMTRHLDGYPFPPHLIGAPGQRPPLLPWYDSSGRCALTVRWEDPAGGGDGSHCVAGQQVFGNWSTPHPWA
jgi:hypothetical protein